MYVKASLISVVATISAMSLVGCGTEADRVTRNVSLDAENFKVTRRLVVVNTITDKPTLELVGKFSIDVDSAEDQLEIVVEVEEGTYKKHFVGLSETVTYVVEDISGAEVPNNKYQIMYLDDTIIPVEVKSNK